MKVAYLLVCDFSKTIFFGILENLFLIPICIIFDNLIFGDLYLWRFSIFPYCGIRRCWNFKNIGDSYFFKSHLFFRSPFFNFTFSRIMFSSTFLNFILSKIFLIFAILDFQYMFVLVRRDINIAGGPRQFLCLTE